MLNKFRIGAASLLVAGGLAACAGGPQGDSVAQNASTPHVVRYQDLGRYNAFYGNQIAEARPFRSKCEDLTDLFQYRNCVQNEIDELAQAQEGELKQ